MSNRGLVVLVLLAALNVACTASRWPRLYDGEERAPHEVAFLSISDGNATGVGSFLRAMTPMRRQARFVEIDGVEVEEHATHFEILPGPHDLCAAFSNDFGSFLLLGRLRFEAIAGHRYSVEIRDIGRGEAIVVVDTTSDEVLDDSEVKPAEVRTPAIDFGGEAWTVADDGISCRQQITTWVPEGESLKSWSRIVEALDTELVTGRTADLDALLADRRAAIEKNAKEVVFTPLERSENDATFTYSGDYGRRGRHEPRSGVGLLRVVEHGVLLFTYERKDGSLDDAERALWLEHFRTARLR